MVEEFVLPKDTFEVAEMSKQHKTTEKKGSQATLRLMSSYCAARWLVAGRPQGEVPFAIPKGESKNVFLQPNLPQ